MLCGLAIASTVSGASRYERSDDRSSMMAGVRRSLLACILLLTLCVSPAPVSAGAIPERSRRAANETTGSRSGEATGEEGELRYSVAKFDFAHVAGPLIVTGWILLASIAKIGEYACVDRSNTIHKKKC